MPRYNINLITSRRSYNLNEVASLLGINRKTCGRWIKYEGLKVLEENKTPILIIGTELINFIKKKREKRKVILKENQFFCVKCQKAVRAKTGSEKIIKTGKKIGRNNQEQFKKIGICENCQTKINKFLSVYQRD